MTIKQRLPWPLRFFVILIFIAIIGGALFWVYQLGGDFSGTNIRAMRNNIDTLNQQIATLTKENARLSSVADASESQLNMMRASRDQFATQVSTLESENVKIKEDLAFFDSLLPTNLGSQGMTLNRIQMDQVSPTQLRYRLLVLRGQQRANDFVGQLALDVTVSKNGKLQQLHYPAIGSEAEKDRFKLVFKYYQRIDSMLTLPEGVIVKSVLVKVIYNGQVRVQQTINM